MRFFVNYTIKLLLIVFFFFFSVSWKKISIFIFPGGNILPSRMVEALNESIVALCCVPEVCVSISIICNLVIIFLIDSAVDMMINHT